MYTNIWIKYLPVLRIVLKRSLAAEQKFALNVPDFSRAGFTRKSGYKFLLKFREGRLGHVVTDDPLASLLVTALLEDAAVKPLLANNEFHLSLNTKYELTVRHIQTFDTAATDEPTATTTDKTQP